MGLITISRGTFGGGKAVAELLAKRLGYVNLSREVVSGEAAERYEIPDEQMLHSISELPGNFRLGESEHRRNMAYFRMIILERAVKSPTVYHSHGGHLILSGISGFMRVRINAGIECRIKYAIQERNIDYKSASALITAIDQKRKQWSQEVWGVEWNEPSLYDLVLNLDQLSVEGAVEIISTASTLPEFADSPAHRQVLEDELLKARIWVELIKNSHTQRVRININVTSGQVTFTGDVSSNKMKDAIIATAAEIHGVDKVINNLCIGSSWHW
jgi:osmotically-inducible protein OsmY